MSTHRNGDQEEEHEVIGLSRAQNNMLDSSNHTIQGAKPSELVIEACRRNNTELLTSVIEQCGSPEAVAKLLNESKSVLGNYAYHEAAANGNC
jgi:hypothetical protein